MWERCRAAVFPATSKAMAVSWNRPRTGRVRAARTGCGSELGADRRRRGSDWTKVLEIDFASVSTKKSQVGHRRRFARLHLRELRRHPGRGGVCARRPHPSTLEVQDYKHGLTRWPEFRNVPYLGGGQAIGSMLQPVQACPHHRLPARARRCAPPRGPAVSKRGSL